MLNEILTLLIDAAQNAFRPVAENGPLN